MAAMQVSDTEYEYFFDRAYFHMDKQKFNVLKALPVTDSVEVLQTLLLLKFRS